MLFFFEHEILQASLAPSFPGLDYSSPHVGQTTTSCGNTNQVVDYMVNAHPTAPAPPQQPPLVPGFCGGSTSLDKLSFADVMQFADLGPKLGLNEANKVSEEETGLDPVYFLKFPVLNEKVQGDDGEFNEQEVGKEGGGSKEDGAGAGAVQLRFLDENVEKYAPAAAGAEGNKGKRKRPRVKTNEEVESQRMTHIAVERNRRKQMNEHLRVLRSLMPGSYVQRGDQASIIGGAIEFVRELEQLLQCLESQKRRRLYGDAPPARPMAAGDSSTSPLPPLQQQPPFFPAPNEYEAAGICEETTAGSKSCLADVEVKLLGFDGMIKILSRRRPSQLIKVIAALEDLQLSILHTNITTIEQTVLYSFNVKISSETRYTAEDLANSVQQIFSFINSNSI